VTQRSTNPARPSAGARDVPRHIGDDISTIKQMFPASATETQTRGILGRSP
jgi:hypothetical protein